MRDFDAKPYSEDETRVAKFLCDHVDVGGGDDPIGFILSSYAYLIEQRRRMQRSLETIANRDPDKPDQHIQWAVAVAMQGLEDQP